MFLKIFCLLAGIILLGTGALMTEEKVSERYNVYKMIIGAEIAFVGLIIITLSLLAIFPQLLPF